MDRGHVYKLVAERLNSLGSGQYETLLARVDEPEEIETITLNGELVIVSTAVRWEDKKSGRLRVLVSAYGPSSFRIERVEESTVIGQTAAARS